MSKAGVFREKAAAHAATASRFRRQPCGGAAISRAMLVALLVAALRLPSAAAEDLTGSRVQVTFEAEAGDSAAGGQRTCEGQVLVEALDGGLLFGGHAAAVAPPPPCVCGGGVHVCTHVCACLVHVLMN